MTNVPTLEGVKFYCQPGAPGCGPTMTMTFGPAGRQWMKMLITSQWNGMKSWNLAFRLIFSWGIRWWSWNLKFGHTCDVTDSPGDSKYPKKGQLSSRGRVVIIVITWFDGGYMVSWQPLEQPLVIIVSTPLRVGLTIMTAGCSAGCQKTMSPSQIMLLLY